MQSVLFLRVAVGSGSSTTHQLESIQTYFCLKHQGSLKIPPRPETSYFENQIKYFHEVSWKFRGHEVSTKFRKSDLRNFGTIAAMAATLPHRRSSCRRAGR